MDEIILRNMQFFGYHGVLTEETSLGQRFLVSLRLRLSLGQAGVSDDVRDTVDYGAVYQRVKQIVEGSPAKLIETVAERIAQDLLMHFPKLESVVVDLDKPGAPIPGILESASVHIERSQSGNDSQTII